MKLPSAEKAQILTDKNLMKSNKNTLKNFYNAIKRCIEDGKYKAYFKISSWDEGLIQVFISELRSKGYHVAIDYKDDLITIDWKD